MSDIVEWLRELVNNKLEMRHSDLLEAADEIERLRAEAEHQRKEAKYWYDRYVEFVGRMQQT